MSDREMSEDEALGVVRSALHEPEGWLRVLVGATWKHWSAYENPVENATAGTPPQSPPGYHDTVVPRIAGEASREWGRVRLSGRLGYYFEWSPAPQGEDRAGQPSEDATPCVRAARAPVLHF